MSDDIVDKLRDNEVSRVGAGFFTFPYARQAADEIERLRQQVDNLSKQLDQAVSRD